MQSHDLFLNTVKFLEESARLVPRPVDVYAEQGGTAVAQEHPVRIQHGKDDEPDVLSKVFGNAVLAG